MLAWLSFVAFGFSPSLPPDVAAGKPTDMCGGGIGVYLGPDLGPYMKLLPALGKVLPRATIYLERGSRGVEFARGVGWQLASTPFDVTTIGREFRLFVHHGGLGITQLCAAAGVPQFILFHDTEKWLNGEAVMETGAGVALPVHLARPTDIANAIGRASTSPVRKAAERWRCLLPAQKGTSTRSLIMDYIGKHYS